MAKKRIQREIRLIIILAVLSVIFFGLTFGIKAINSQKENIDQEYIDAATMAELPNRIEVTDESGSFALVSDKGSWYLEGNEEVPINGLRVTAVRSVSKYFAPGRIMTDQQENLTAFGLKDPATTVKLISSEGEMTYLVGDYNYVTREYYVALEGSNTVYLIPRTDGENLKTTLLGYVDDPAIVDASFNQITEIDVEAGDLKYVIDIGNGTYTARNDVGSMELDQATVMAIFNCFTYSTEYTCVEFVCEASELAAYGLDKPAVTVNFVSGDGGCIMYAATGKDGGHYVTDGSRKIIYFIDEEDYNTLLEAIRIG